MITEQQIEALYQNSSFAGVVYQTWYDDAGGRRIPSHPQQFAPASNNRALITRLLSHSETSPYTFTAQPVFWNSDRWEDVKKAIAGRYKTARVKLSGQFISLHSAFLREDGTLMFYDVNGVIWSEHELTDFTL